MSEQSSATLSRLEAAVDRLEAAWLLNAEGRPAASGADLGADSHAAAHPTVDVALIARRLDDLIAQVRSLLEA